MPRKRRDPKSPENPEKAVCENCTYFHGRYAWGSCCNYLLDTGKMRGCEADEKCSKFFPKKRR